MQTYGKFFNPPKRGKQIVDNWSIAGSGRLLNQTDQHIFKAALVVGIGFVNRFHLCGSSKSDFCGMFLSLFYFHQVKKKDGKEFCY
jgi:hypothetical protein